MGFGIGCGFSLSMAPPVDVAHDGAFVAATTGLMLFVASATAGIAVGATLSPGWLRHARAGSGEPSPVAM